MLVAEAGGDVIEVGHGADVDPGLRHRDHHIGAAEAELVNQQYSPGGIRNAFAHQVFAGDAECTAPRASCAAISLAER